MATPKDKLFDLLTDSLSEDDRIKLTDLLLNSIENKVTVTVDDRYVTVEGKELPSYLALHDKYNYRPRSSEDETDLLLNGTLAYFCVGLTASVSAINIIKLLLNKID